MKRLSLGITLAIVAFYLITHFYKLTLLPVFTDESIYIRWSQLIIDDWKQYLFFPLNDGKTPLQMWSMVPLLLIGKDPLWMARALSVLVGLAQLFVTAKTVRSLGGKQTTAWLAMILTAIIPFWYFHHRMALIDAMLTLFLSLSVWGLIELQQAKKRHWRWVLVAGISFGLAMLTKLPAILFLPTFPLFTFLSIPKDSRVWLKRMVLVGVSAGIGLAIFASLKLHPAFSQLFARGGDFLHPWRYVLLEGGWTSTIRNIPTYLIYGIHYLTLPIMVLLVFGLFSPDEKRRTQLHIMFWSMMAFAAPIALMGKVVYPRYFMPMILFATPIVALTLETFVERYVRQSTTAWKQILAALAVALLLANTASQSLGFIAASITNPAHIPFVSIDKEQYLHEWSSGHGIVETVSQIRDKAKTGTIAVATEGSFGTLPDAILMYLHRTDVSNIYVDGIGYPVKTIPEKFSQRATEFETVWLVVNSHRLELRFPPENLVAEYCRPDNAPCLQIWDITSEVH